jgi:peroxiredoxin
MLGANRSPTDSDHPGDAMTRSLFLAAAAFALAVPAARAAEPPARKVAVGEQAPAFKVKDASGKEIDLAELTARGPVLVRLTCGCAGCDKELAYFQELHAAYKDKGLTSLAVFKEPDEKVAKYVREKKLDMLYAVDPKGASWDVFQTRTMPSNFLIDRGGKVVAIATGCDTSGLLARNLSKKVAAVVDAPAVDVKAKVDERKEK